MAMRWRKVAVLSAVAFAVAGCAAPADDSAPGSSAAACGPELRTVFSAEVYGGADIGEFFRVFGAIELRDGSVVLSFDPDTPGAGDEGDQTEPRLVILEPGGTVQPLNIPPVEGLDVGENAAPLLVGPDGVLYVFDRHSRVLAGQGGKWRVITTIPDTQLFSAPKGIVGPDGRLYLVLTTAVVRVEESGQLTPVAGASARPIEDVDAVEVLPPRGVPGLATRAELPLLSGASFFEDGTILVSSQEYLYRVDPSGYMSVLAASLPVAGLEVPVLPAGDDALSSVRLAGVATRGDTVWIADQGQQRLFRLAPTGLSVAMTTVSAILGDVYLSEERDGSLLVTRNGGEVLCAYDL